ncbi:taste receptor type 2 member 10-like [Mauremys mutica]|uniref:taste receptor type 2 member 10-like n=1 Tax=Mauremys mutica TaxID=74926 RepID=UPI001D1449D2|nr:taste receptor type 2 member 10-like [Mauremys mutica]
MFINQSSLWFTTWFSIFYYLKITSFTHFFLLWLRLRISGLMLWLLLRSQLGSLESFFSFMIFLILIILLIISLWRNIRHMQHSISILSNPNTEVHAGDVRVLISFLIFYVLYFMASVSMITVAIVKTSGYG